MKKAPIKLINAYQDLMHELDKEILKIDIDNDLYKKINIEEIRNVR